MAASRDGSTSPPVKHRLRALATGLLAIGVSLGAVACGSSSSSSSSSSGGSSSSSSSSLPGKGKPPLTLGTKNFTLGARPEFLNRQEGAKGMKSAYGISNFTFKSLALGLQYQALDSHAIDAADIFTTDPQLASGKYTVLTDPKGVFGYQNIALVIDKSKLN